MTFSTLSAALFSSPACEPSVHSSGCRNAACATLAAPYGGRWYITFGHAGYNLPANNGRGYATEQAARAAVAKCLRPAK